MRHIYAIIDTETSTLPRFKAENKGLYYPLIYDIGIVITDRNGRDLYRNSFIVDEIYNNDEYFKSAYYAEKRPYYDALIRDNLMAVRPWFWITQELVTLFKMYRVTHVCAYNAHFDFKRAFPFTNNFIYAHKRNNVEDFLSRWGKSANIDTTRLPWHKNTLALRGNHYKILDIWNAACDTFLNYKSYKDMAEDNGWLNAKGEYRTTAEYAYCYIQNDNTFSEAHTALADAEIETVILHKVIATHRPFTYGIVPFPNRKVK